MGAVTTTPVDVHVVDDLATVTLGRVERANALDAATVDALLDAVDTAEAEGCRVLVLRSDAEQFCAGFDLDGVPDSTSADLLWRFLRIGLLLERLQTSALLTVAVLDGPAVGAGADVAAACDLRIGTQRTSFRFPGSAFGVVLGTRRLAAVVGDGAAVRLAATGEAVDADEAHRVGLLDVLVPLGEVDRRIGRIVRSASVRRPATLGALKAAVVPPDPSGLADLARSLVTQPDLAAAMAEFARRARPTPREESA